MSDLLLFILIVIFGLIPFGFGVMYTLYKGTIVFPVATMVFIASMFCAIVAFAVSELGFKSLYWAIPVSLIFLVSVNFVFKKQIQRPLKTINENLSSMSQGILNFKIDDDIILKNNELGTVANSLSTTLKGLHNTSMFASEIAKGNFNLEYNLLSNKDEIGLALLAMQKSLVESAKLEEQRKLEEQNVAFITNGVAKFSDLLRMHTDNIQKLGYSLLKELVDYVGAVQGALFVLNEETEGDVYFELAAAIAYDREKSLKKKIKVGESLVGRCVFEKLPIYMKEVPQNYINITSGLGDANPQCILLVPAMVEDKVYAVIELASFSVFEKHIISFIEKISDNVASVISNVRNNEKTRKLLEESKQYAEEMAAQEEELRQNIEELHATQEEMNRKERQLAELAARLEQQEELLGKS